MSDIQSVLDTLDNALASGQLLESSRDNIQALLEGTTSPVAAVAIAELADNGSWQELNDRFFKTLAFGTGGLRGRTSAVLLLALSKELEGLMNAQNTPA